MPIGAPVTVRAINTAAGLLRTTNHARVNVQRVLMAVLSTSSQMTILGYSQRSQGSLKPTKRSLGNDQGLSEPTKESLTTMMLRKVACAVLSTDFSELF